VKSRDGKKRNAGLELESFWGADKKTDGFDGETWSRTVLLVVSCSAFFSFEVQCCIYYSRRDYDHDK
jgi:hypothetical protein